MNSRIILTFCSVISVSMARVSAVTEPRLQTSNRTIANDTDQRPIFTVTNNTTSEIITSDKPKDLEQDDSQDEDNESKLSSEELEYSGRIKKDPRNRIKSGLFKILKDKTSNKTVNGNYKNKTKELEIRKVTSTKGNGNLVLENNGHIKAFSDSKIKSDLERKKVTEAMKLNLVRRNNTNIPSVPTKNDTVRLFELENKIKSKINESVSSESKSMTLLRETQKPLGFNYTILHDLMPQNLSKMNEDQNKQQSKHKTNLKDKENVQNIEVLNSTSLSMSTVHDQATVNHSKSNDAHNFAIQNASTASVQKNDPQNIKSQHNNNTRNDTSQKYNAQNAIFLKNDQKNKSIQNKDEQNAKIVKNDAKNTTVQNNNAPNSTFLKNDTKYKTVQNNDAQIATTLNNDTVKNIRDQNDNAQNATNLKNDAKNITVQNNNAQNATNLKNDAKNITVQNNNAKNATNLKNDAKNITVKNNNAKNSTNLKNDTKNITVQNNNAQNATNLKNGAKNITVQNNVAKNVTLQYLKPILLGETQTQTNEKPPQQRPNIVFIVADDLGWDDVSLHGSDHILTPNMDVLGYSGLVLSQYYTDVRGTAARSALFTGKYPLRLGTGGESIGASEDRSIPPTQRLLPGYLRALGYSTHLLGKWDVGKSRRHYLPTERGFHTFYGFLGSAVDYYTYNQIEEINQTSYFGLDLFNGTTPVDQQQGYLTDVITDRAVQIIRSHDLSQPLYLHVSHLAPHSGGGLVPLQATVSAIHANRHIAHSASRLYAGMVTSLDNSVGTVMAALAERRMLHNTLVVLVADNGAPAPSYGSNRPLRGGKGSPWEGAARTTAVLWAQALQPGTYPHLFHVTDWLPTLITAAGANGNVDDQLDGVDQWRALAGAVRGAPRRNDLLVGVDDTWAALREGHFKVVVGDVHEPPGPRAGTEYRQLRQDPPSYEQALIESKTFKILKESLNLTLNIDEALAKRRQFILNNQMLTKNASDYCVPNKDKGCLYNITRDPLESLDLWDTYPEIVRRLTLRLRTIWTELQPGKGRGGRDPRADPARHGYVWAPWVGDDEGGAQPVGVALPFPAHVSLGEIQYLVDLNLNMFRQTVFESIQSMGNSFLKTINGLF